jgi:hypothetical protein
MALAMPWSGMTLVIRALLVSFAVENLQWTVSLSTSLFARSFPADRAQVQLLSMTEACRNLAHPRVTGERQAKIFVLHVELVET